MRFLCCLPSKKGKKSKKNRRESTTRQNVTTTEPIKNTISNKNVAITDQKDKEIIPLKSDTDNITTENIVPIQDGNTSIDTSVAAVTALSYAPSTEDHSYYVIDHTYVSSLERDRLQDKYDSLQLYSPSPSTTPSIHSNRKSLTEFQSAISLESTESFFTTASYNGGDDTNSNPNHKPLSKRTSTLSNTNYTNDNSIRVHNNNNKRQSSHSYFQSRKSLSFLSFKRSKSSKSSINKDRKDKDGNTNTDSNATANNLIYRLNKNNEVSTHSTDITVNNLIVVSNNTINDPTTNSKIMVTARDLNATTVNPTINNTINSLEKDESLSMSSDVTPFLSKQLSTTKPTTSSSNLSSVGKTKSKTSVLTSKDLDSIAERALHPNLTEYTLDAVIKK